MKRYTLKGKVSLCLSAIVLGFLTACGLLFGMMNYIQGRMDMLMNINTRVYGLKSMVNEVTGAYQYFMLSADWENEELLRNALDRLLAESAALEADIFRENYVREIEDLCNMILTLSEQTETGLENFRNYSRQEKIQSYDDISYTAELIDKYYDYVYPAMEQFYDLEESGLKREKDTILAVLGAVILLMLAGVIAMLAWFSRNVARPILQLSYKAATFRTEEPDLSAANQDEVRNLMNTFDAMVLRIEEQVGQMELNMRLELELKQQRIERIKMEKLLQESEMKALQARINPHFMFNTLNSVAQMAYLEGAEQTELMIEAVSDFFRYNLKDIHHVSMIEDEIKNVKDYIFIQKMRFGNRICFHLDFDEAAGKGRIPALTLQPVIENSIVHGLGLCRENGRVDIEVKRTGADQEKIVIRIQDNGTGIDPEKLAEITGYLKGADIEGIHSDSIGLKNVIDRMRAFFGTKFEMNVRSQPSEKTLVEMVIPYEENLCIKY